MPVFELELSDGKKFQVETDRPPTEAELPQLMEHLQAPSSVIQKMNPTRIKQPADREAWMQDGVGDVTQLNPAEGLGTILGMATAGVLNQGKRFLTRMHGMEPQATVVDGKIVFKPTLTEQQANTGARFETTGPSGQLAEQKAPTFVGGQPLVQARFANEDIDPIERVIGNTLRGFTTPENLGALAGGIGLAGKAPMLAQALPTAVFGTSMLAHAPESTRQVGEAVGTVLGTPQEQRTPEMIDRLKESIANEVVSKLMLGGVLGHAGTMAKNYKANQPIDPEVLPRKEGGYVPPTRQIAQTKPSVIDAEVLEAGNRLPQARRFYQSESKNPSVDASQLTQRELDARLQQYKPFEPLAEKKAYQEPITIGENEPQSIAKSLGVRYDGIQDYGGFVPKKEAYTSLNPDNPFTVYVDVGTSKAEIQARLAEKQRANIQGRETPTALIVPELSKKPINDIQGGKISFSAPAESGAIPSARQAGLPIGEAKAIAPQSPQMGQGAKMIAPEYQSSGEKSKSPINEADLSDSKNESNQGIEYRNTGALTKKQQDWVNDFVTKGLTKMINEGRVPTGQDKQRLELAAQDKVKHEVGLQTFANDFNKELNRQAENLSLRGSGEIADRFNRAMDSQVLPHVRNAVERTETQKDGSVILEVDNYFHNTNQGRIALRRLANEGVRVSWEERNYAPGKSRLRLTKQEPNPNLNKEFAEQAKSPFIQHYNTGALTKQQQDWITSSARKLLSSPKDLRYSPDRKGEYDGGQLVARLLNNVPPGEREVLEQAGIKERFKAGQKVSSEEVDKWIQENEPKVEVRKFTTGSKDKRTMYESKERYLTQKQADIEHDLDTADSNWRNYFTLDEGIPNVRFPHYIKQEFGYRNSTAIDAKIAEFNHIQNQRFVNNRTAGGGFITSPNETHWQSVAPKPESEMKDYVEIAVVKPNAKKMDTVAVAIGRRPTHPSHMEIVEQPQFPSSHNFPPNTLGFVRGYMEGDTFHVIEVQSDWAQQQRQYKQEFNPEQYEAGSRAREIAEKSIAEREKKSDPLLAHYERLALKSAIEHARASGAKRIAIQDAESAMLMEGHDRDVRELGYQVEVNDGFGNWQPVNISSTNKRANEVWSEQAKKHGDENVRIQHIDRQVIDQEKGMRLHYDQILPKMLRELTGEQGEKVSFGEHKMASTRGDSVTWSVEMPAGEILANDFTDKAQAEAYAKQRGGKIVRTDIRQDLIFRNPDNTPKTDITALSFPLDKVSEAQSKAPFTLMGSDKVKADKDEQGNVVYYHSGMPVPKEAIKAAKDMLTLSGKALNLYAEPIVEKLGRVGGPVAKKATEEFQRMISRQKQVYGELSPVVDAAKKVTGKMGGGNVWLRKTNNITDKAAVNNFFNVNEGGSMPPVEARNAISLTDRANMAIGRAAQLANPDFVPTGKLQRVLTNYGFDIIKRGNGPAWEAWTEGVAKANNANIQNVRDFFGKWKEELDKPSSDVASMDRISQDFSRKFPKTVTHIKPGMAWHEVVVADPYNYTESAAQRTSHAVAFREVYPLVRDPKTGKLGPSGYLQATRKAIQKELNTAGFDSNLFDNLVSAVQGHPLDTFTKGWNAPDSVVGGAYRMGQQLVGQPLKSLMLTANTISNAGEILAGGPAIFHGTLNTVRAMKELAKDNTLASYLEFIGARNKAMYNFSFDPTSPVRSISRIASNALRKVTAQQLFNEIQETTAAMSAKFVADRARSKNLSPYESNRMEAVARVMGFTSDQAKKMVTGDTDLLRQFETKSAAALTAGNQAMAEKSRLGTSRAFNELFWFQTYPQMKANQARKILGNFFEDVSKKDWTQAKHNAALFGRFVGGTTMQGAITLMLMGLATAGLYGLKQQGNQAKEETVKFGWDALRSGMGGPLSILARLAQNSKDSKSLTQNLVSLSPPVSAGQELIDASWGLGRYEGRTVPERIGMFLESKTPGLDIGKTLLAVSGLSQDDLELRAAMKGFYQWRREQPDYKPGSSGGGTKAQIELHTQMKRVAETIQKGGDWRKELEKVKDLKEAQSSLRNKTLLELNQVKLTKEQLASLEKRIGKKGVEKIQTYDTMIREIARELGDVNKEKKTLADVKPTGDKYVDQTTSTQRSESIMEKLSPETIKFLEMNKKKIPSYEPEFGLVKKKLMSKEEAQRFETIYAEELDKRLASKMTNEVFLAKPLVKRQESIQERIELAKEIAEVRFRAGERKLQERQ